VGKPLGDLLSSVDLGDLLLDELVSLLADVYDLGAGNTESGNILQDLLGDLRGGLVLGKSVGVVEGIVWQQSREASVIGAEFARAAPTAATERPAAGEAR